MVAGTVDLEFKSMPTCLYANKRFLTTFLPLANTTEDACLGPCSSSWRSLFESSAHESIEEEPQTELRQRDVDQVPAINRITKSTARCSQVTTFVVRTHWRRLKILRRPDHSLPRPLGHIRLRERCSRHYFVQPSTSRPGETTAVSSPAPPSRRAANNDSDLPRFGTNR